LGEDRNSSGVKPSVEVKKPEAPEPIDPEELADQNANEPSEKATPKPDQTKPVQEDVQLKRAIEILKAA